MTTSTETVKVETFGQGPNLTLIHGWGAQNAAWREWCQNYLAKHCTVTLIELPGFGESAPLKLDDTAKPEAIEQAWVDALAAVLPDNTHLLGWSLGGLLAQQLCLKEPKKIKSLIQVVPFVQRRLTLASLILNFSFLCIVLYSILSSNLTMTLF